MVEGYYGFPILEGEFHKRKGDLHLRGSGGEGSNVFGNRFS